MATRSKVVQYESYCELREMGVPILVAAERLGVTDRTAARYEQERKQAENYDPGLLEAE